MAKASSPKVVPTTASLPEATGPVATMPTVEMPEVPPCPLPEGVEAPLDAELTLKAITRLPDQETRVKIARVLGVDCASPSNSFDTALVQAIARFQLRYGRFADEVTGRFDARTERILQMVHAELRGPDDPCRTATANASADDATLLPGCLLRWPGATSEQLAFMRLVYAVARERAAKNRPFVMAADEVDVIERGPCPGKPSEVEPGCQRTQWAERAAAHATQKLLAAARATFDADRTQHGQRNLMVFTGYRSAPFQLEVWEYHFPARYEATAKARARARGGPHGHAAAELLAQHYAVRTAAPGHSLHGRGIAIDFGCVTREGEWIGSNGSFVKAWKGSFCFRWLKQNARRFGFRLNDSIDEPWHWEFVGE